MKTYRDQVYYDGSNDPAIDHKQQVKAAIEASQNCRNDDNSQEIYKLLTIDSFLGLAKSISLYVLEQQSPGINRYLLCNEYELREDAVKMEYVYDADQINLP